MHNGIKSDSSSDDMASFEILHTQNAVPNSFESNDFSFIPDQPMNCVENGQPEFDMTNMQTALVSNASDLSSEEIHSRLVDLLHENETMKEALKKNNSIMQEQLSTITAWHEQMSLTKSKQQACIEKAKEKISNLEIENNELKKEIDNLKKQYEEELANKPCSKCEELEEVTRKMEEEKNKLIAQKHELTQKISSEKAICLNLEEIIMNLSNYLDNLQSNSKLPEAEKRELTALNNTLQLKLATLDTDFGTSTITDEENGYEVVLHDEAKEVQKSLVDQNSAREEIIELKKQLEEKDKEIKSLKSFQEASLISEHKKQNMESGTESVVESTSDAALTNSERCKYLEKKIAECEEKLQEMKAKDFTIEQLHADMKDLQEILKLERLENQNERAKCLGAERNAETLKADNDRLSQLLEQHLKEQAEQFEAAKNKLEKYFNENIDSLTAQLMDYSQKIEEKDTKLKEMSLELFAIKEEVENIPILKSQIEVYTNDLRETTTALAAAEDEVNRLKNELKQLQHPENSGTPGRSKGKDKKNKDGCDLICPMCNCCFSSFHVLETHVNKCIDKNGVVY